jgi:hypothetical protein
VDTEVPAEDDIWLFVLADCRDGMSLSVVGGAGLHILVSSRGAGR